jgi:hypothetical protein
MTQQTLLVDGHLNAAKVQKRLASSGVLLHFWSKLPKASLTTLMQRKPLFWSFTAFLAKAD